MSANPPLRKDATHIITRALPNGANTVNSTAIDLELGANADFVGNQELLISAPALATADLPDTKTMKYHVVHDDDSDISDGTVLASEVIVQTGAGGAGAAAATARFRLPSNVKRYVGLRAVNDGTGDASDKDATLEMVY